MFLSVFISAQLVAMNTSDDAEKWPRISFGILAREVRANPEDEPKIKFLQDQRVYRDEVLRLLREAGIEDAILRLNKEEDYTPADVATAAKKLFMSKR